MKIVLFKGKKYYYTLTTHLVKDEKTNESTNVSLQLPVYFDKKGIDSGEIKLSKSAIDKLNQDKGFILFNIADGTLARSKEKNLSYISVYAGHDEAPKPKEASKETKSTKTAKKSTEDIAADLPF